MIDVQKIEELIRTASRRFIEPRWRNLKDGDVLNDAPTDVVTRADIEAEQFLTEQLLALYPAAVIIGEEADKENPGAFATTDLSKGIVFTLDPVDGTAPFAAGDPDFGTMVSASVDGLITYAWILLPQLNKFLFAERGKGVTVNGARQQIASAANTADTVVIYQPKAAAYIEVLKNEPWRKLAPSRSIAAETVAAIVSDDGRMGSAHTSINVFKPWDYVPTALAYHEAGAYVWRQHGDALTVAPPSVDSIVYATSPAIGERIKKLIV